MIYLSCIVISIATCSEWTVEEVTKIEDGLVYHRQIQQ